MVAVDAWTGFGGRHSETAVLRNVLGQLEVLAPHTGEPFTEAALLGIGGGIGAAYWVFEYKAFGVPYPSLSLGTRHGWGFPSFLTGICDRLGVPIVKHETTSAKAAAARLRAALADGRPTIVWVDMASLPYRALPREWKGAVPHVVGVRIADAASDTVALDDLAGVPIVVSWDDLASARSGHRASKHRLLVLDLPTDRADLESAILAGIRACVQGMTAPPEGLPPWAAGNYGVAGIGKWADLMADPKEKRGWPKLFTPGLPLYKGLSAIFAWVEVQDTPGGAFRGMYGEFLEESAGVSDRPALAAAAGRYRDLGQMWTAFAAAALPGEVEPLRRTRELMSRKSEIFAKRGADAHDETLAIESELWAIEKAMVSDFPLGEGDSRALLEELGGRLRAIHASEVEAVEALSAALS